VKEDDPKSRDSARKQAARARKAAVAYPKITPRSLTDSVINTLKDALLEGRLRPGEAIVERDVAMQMKVGMPVVREALIALQGKDSFGASPIRVHTSRNSMLPTSVNFICFG